MTIKAALHDHLVGLDVVGDRVFWGLAPQGQQRPYIVLHRVTADHDYHLGGSSGLVEDLFQIDCVADSAEAAEDLSEAVRDGLDTFRGDMRGVFVNDVHLRDESDEPMIPVGSSGASVVRNRMDFSIWHAEAVPTA